MALRKVQVLLDFGAQITVVAPQIDPQILQLTGNVCVKERTFEPEDLKECVLVVAATDDVTENHRIARMAQKSIFRSMPWISRRTAVLFSVLSETPGSGGGFFQCGKQSGAHTVFKRISERNSDGRTGTD